MALFLIILLVALLLGSAPAWPHSKNWGYGPIGGLGVILIIVVILVAMGRIPMGF